MSGSKSQTKKKRQGETKTPKDHTYRHGGQEQNREVIDRLREDVSDYEKNISIYGSIKKEHVLLYMNVN